MAEKCIAVHSEVVRLLIEYRTDIFAFIFAAVRDYDAAEEVMQNVSVVVCEKAQEYEPGTNFRAWAREIARRQVLQYSRQSKRSPSPLTSAELEYLAAAFDEAECEGSLGERIEALRACLEKLPDRVRNLVRLRYEERLSVEQMAERSHSKVESVRKALYRGRIALRNCIDRRLGMAG
jgi:RNA polymerase sigma-70 factor (ECF subfamily)